MRLTDLEPYFIRYETRREEVKVISGDADTWSARGCPSHTEVRPVEHMIPVATLPEAQGIAFICPKCHAGDGHLVAVSFAGRGVLMDQGSHDRHGKPSRWTVSGTGMGDLTLTPSIDISGNDGKGCGWHGFVTGGEAA